MKSFTQLVGTTTPYAYPGSFCDLSQNNSTANVNLGKILINNQHRYYLQKFFDNESSVFLQTIGADTLTLTGGLSIGDVTANLSSAWLFPSAQQLVVFSGGEQRTVYFTQGSIAIYWNNPLIETATDSISTVGVQFYRIPANVSKIKNDTITIGQLVYTSAPVQSIQEWTMLNALPYTSDIPAYFFIYENQIGFFPIPSSTGNTITLNVQLKVQDMSLDDYSTGTVAGESYSNEVTGTTTLWETNFAGMGGVDISNYNLKIRVLPGRGDGLWYPIERFNSETTLLLNTPIVNYVQSKSFTGASYVIGQIPLLQEDFEDILVYSSLKIYYSSIVKDKTNYELYSDLTAQREELMKAYLGTKSVNVDLGNSVLRNNPNLYIYSSS